jgi:hypothetical protein
LCAAGALALAVPALQGTASAAPAANATCSGGSIAAGTYSSLTVSGFCSVDAGNVTVTKNVTLAPGGGLLAAFGGSDLNVGGNLIVGANAILVLGCEPVAFVCFNDPDQVVGTLRTNDRVGGNLTADGALMVLAHNNIIVGNLAQSGGGGGVTCSLFPLGPDGPPAYSTFEDNAIGGNASVTGVGTCWLGFIRNTVVGNVNFSGNVTFDPDGNEVVTNSAIRNLNCSGNSPKPQFGDSAGNLNTVGGKATGQCVGLTQ